MEKLNSLPDLLIGDIAKRNNVEDILGIDTKRLFEKLSNYFERNVDMKEVFDVDHLTFKNEMNDASLLAFLALYNRLTDKEIAYALWSFIDAQLRIRCLDSAGGA